MTHWHTQARALSPDGALFEANLGPDDILERSPDNSAARAPAAPQRASQAVSIALRALNKSYGERRVLSDIELDVAAGEFVAVIGRSGCGKSTLLRIVADLERPDAPPAAPLLRVHGEAAGSRPEVRIMFQEARLLPWRTVAQNVALGLQGGLESVAVVLESVGLSDRAQDWPLKLSGGQRQRVALARALIHKPGLLLLDEPLGALDALTRIEMQELIAAVWARERFTALLVTHDVAEAVALADRVVLIEKGRVGFEAKVDLPRPRSRGSAAFAALEASILERVLASGG